MAGSPSDKQLRATFKTWALDRISSTPGHPLQCLVDNGTNKWHPNMIRSEQQPSVDAGHLTSKWTGAPPKFALEDSDSNRYFNHGENKTRHGVFFEKSAVLIGGVPVEYSTAKMLESTGKLKPGTVAAAPFVKGAVYSANRGFTVETIESSATEAQPIIPSMPSNASLQNKIGEVASNRDVVAFVGESIGAVSTWLNERGIARNVEEQLKTKYAEDIRKIHSAGNGALVIVRIERYANPSADYHLENAQLVGVDVVGGANVEEAMTKWRQPKFLVGPSSGYRIDESYMWMTKPKNGE